MNREPITAKELGLLLGVSEEVVLAWVETGMIPYRREGDQILFDPAILERWMEEKAKALYGDDF
ncbi:MAG: helix-turn-helix domain-containing protein [Bdellovibrionota bacterium]